MVKKAKTVAAQEPPVPQLTFTEDEHKTLVDYLNFMHTRARFDDMHQGDAYKLGQLYIKTVNLSKKIEAHIFEHKKTTMTRPK